MLGADVAVTVDHPPVAGAPVELDAAAPQERFGEPAGALESLGGQKGPGGVRELVEVLPPGVCDERRPVRDRRAGRPRVEAGDGARRLHDVLVAQVAAPDGGGHGPVLVEAAHLDDPVDGVGGVRVAGQHDAFAAVDDRADAEHDVGREGLVDRDLLLARPPPCGRLAQVEEAEVDGLLELVGAIARQQHPRHVRLADRDRLAERHGEHGRERRALSHPHWHRPRRRGSARTRRCSGARGRGSGRCR